MDAPFFFMNFLLILKNHYIVLSKKPSRNFFLIDFTRSATLFIWETFMRKFYLFAALLYCAFAMAKGPKLLVLVIASDDKPYYTELQKVWRSYMNCDPEHIEAYFIKEDPNLNQPYKIHENVIWIRMAPSFIPGIGDKTVLAMEAFLPRLKEFDFVLRTNLSSFYVFPRLLEMVKTLPKTRCYYACENKIFETKEAEINNGPYIPFGSGAGFILSPDMVRLMVEHKKEVLGSSLIDDVIFGWFFHNHKIPLIVATRMDLLDLPSWLMWKNNLPAEQYHFRLRNNSEHRRLTHEVQVHKEMAEMFYLRKQKR